METTVLYICLVVTMVYLCLYIPGMHVPQALTYTDIYACVHLLSNTIKNAAVLLLLQY